MFLNLEKKEQKKTAAIDSYGNQICYGQIVEYSDDLAKIIESRNLVLILMKNDIGSLLSYLCCMANRIVPILIGEKTEDQRIRNIIQLYHPAFVLGTEKRLQDLGYEKNDSLPWSETIRTENKGIEQSYGYANTELPDFPLYHELSLLLTTSGSTGSPKLVRHSYYNLECQVKNISAFFEMDGSERPMVDLPIMYTYGLSVVNSHIFAGATILLTDLSITDKRFWQFFREQQASSITGVPYTFETLKRLRFFTMELPSLKMLSQGGGKLSPELQREYAEYIENKGGKYYATYGQTEGSARMTFLPPAFARTKCGSIGHAVPGGKLSLKDENENDILTPDTIGEMYYEGGNVTLGYAEKGTDLEKEDERRGILPTGDMAYFDSDGCYYIVGRKKRFLKIYGYRVSLDECETLIREAYDEECACTGNDDKLIICLTSGEHSDSIREYLLQRTGLYPAAVEIRVVEAIPRNEAGKILYKKLGEII